MSKCAKLHSCTGNKTEKGKGRDTSHFPLTLAQRAAKETARADLVVSEGEKGEKKEKKEPAAVCVVLLESVFCLTLAKVF